MIRKRLANHILVPSAAVLLLSALAPPVAHAQKLSEDDRVEILRGLLSEYATVKTYLPRSKKPLPFFASGQWDKQYWAQAGQQFGPAARVGDLVQITHVDIDNDQIVLEINNGMKGPRAVGKITCRSAWAPPCRPSISNRTPTHPAAPRSRSCSATCP